MPELLLELLSEEIPARMQTRAADDLKRLVSERLAKAQLPFDRADAFVTPRRLVLVVQGLPARQPDLREERKGPRVGAAAKAVEGFVRAAGLASVDQAEVRETDKGAFYFAVLEKPGAETADVLGALLGEVLGALPWPKSMRWGTGTFRWVRPLHGILALFDGKPVPFTLGLGEGAGEVEAGARSRGHRFLAPAEFDVADFADYRAKLAAAKVMLDPAERRALIAAEAARLAAAEGLSVRPDEALLEEVAGLVEWPAPMLGSIDPRFMDVPSEVLITAMRAHQKYFSLLDGEGALAPRFVLVANTETADGGKAIVAGNERVLRARLSDAKFFWDEDRKRTLESRVSKLAQRVFHAKLGSDLQRTERLEALARHLAPVCDADPALAARAARLCKADLTSAMVGEFPELQGIMGRYYARHDAEPDAVAEAIADHYAPQGPGDRCPAAPVGIAVSLADKLDTLIGFFAIGELPTGSKDPFALRRAALGVIRLVTENSYRISLRNALYEAFLGFVRFANFEMVGELQKTLKLIEEDADDDSPAKHIGVIRHLITSANLDMLFYSIGFLEKLNTEAINIEIEVRGSPKNAALLFLGNGIEIASLLNERPFLDDSTQIVIDALGVDRQAVIERYQPRVAEFARPAVEQLLGFLADRLKVHLREQGVRHDLIAAVFAGGEDDFVRLLARVEALRLFLDTDDGANLLVAYRRASNIVRIEENKDNRHYEGEADATLLTEDQETELHRTLALARPGIAQAISEERFADAMAVLADLRAPVDAFFDHVQVNCADAQQRVNRLKLLSQIRSALGGVADFSLIEG